ncbi:HNH endonuclease signature motif containing protein [Brachybacterium sp. GU-2]|uniref:HNH endonuclease signature motif containing protein n=1 Tax=Brachybacterium sp. GU-2 TaxID=3069708 RepID=UPI00280A6752|nr:HNH endonuclease signature motif containing protein [Brachybacterium sp. GU-2]WME23297.1 HNH endonuclease signature motif containing protein [Brachybacterium sp. GU-2]
MGEFDELELDMPSRASADGVPPAPRSDSARPSRVLPPATVPDLPAWRARARRPLTEARILEEVGEGTVESGRVMALHRTALTRARLYAHHLRLLETFFREDPEVQGRPEDADMTALKVAAGLRCTYNQAWSQVLDAHRAVEIMPLTFEYLRRGDLTEAMHQMLLRRVRRLTDEQASQVDAHMATIELPSVSLDTFSRHLRLAVELATAGTLPTPPSQSRDVEIVDVDSTTGTASLLVTGPILEIKGLAHRLDVAARDVQRAQRAALQDGAEGPLPFDLDGDLVERGAPLSLRTLRYALLAHTVLDTDPVQETASPYKLLVTVPVMTLLGRDDAPAMLEGTTPIPAELARNLAAGESAWTRFLTDAARGTHLPVLPETYRPSAAMRLQLRLRHPVCAAPGCTRPTATAAEDDHILEYDHEHPERGGPTSLANLHRLCWQHHQMKTAGLIDPTREPVDHSAPARPLTTHWTLGEDLRTTTEEATDLLTPHTVRLLEHAAAEHERLAAEARRLHAEEQARPRAERVAEDRRAALAKAAGRKVIPPGNPPPDLGDPPF